MENLENKVDISSHLTDKEIGFDTLRNIFNQYKKDEEKTIPMEMGFKILVNVWDYYKVYTGEVYKKKKKKKKILYKKLFFFF